MTNANRVEKSLQLIAHDMGSDILTLPIRTFPHSNTSPIAYTTVGGIYLSQKIIEEDPDNVHVYLAHEIFHHVVEETEKTSHFPPSLVNIAEDYKINQLIYENWGYDVLNVKVKGIRSNLYNKMSVVQVCESLAKESKLEKKHLQGCGCRGIAHPTILAVADRIRRRLQFDTSKRNLFHIDLVDKESFLQTDFSRAKLDDLKTLSNIDPLLIVQGIWAELFLEDPVYTSFTNEQLTNGQAITYSFDPELFRPTTVNNSTEALFAAVLYLKACDNDKFRILWHIASIKQRIRRAKERLYELRGKFREERLASRRIRIQLLIDGNLARTKRMKEKLKIWEETPDLTKLLKEEPIIRLLDVRKSAIISLANSAIGFEENNSVKLPNLEHNRTWRRLQFLARSSSKTYEEIIDLKDTLAKTLENFADSSDSADGLPSQKTPADVPLPDLPEGVLGGGGLEGSDGQSRLKGDKKQSLSTLLTVLEYKKWLESIIAKVQEISSQLVSKRSRKLDELSTNDINFTYGNDLSRVVTSELVLMAEEATRLEFFSRLVNHGLLEQQPPSQKRSPVAVCVDCSGSMEGKKYTTAVSFAIAFISQLLADGRGVALIIYKEKIEKSLNWNKNIPNMQEVLEFLTSAKMGNNAGLQIPILEAYRIKKENGWKDMTTILITDGEDSVFSVDEIFSKKTRGDSIIGVLIGRTAMHHSITESGVFDSVVMATTNDLQAKLVSVGNKIL